MLAKVYCKNKQYKRQYDLLILISWHNFKWYKTMKCSICLFGVFTPRANFGDKCNKLRSLNMVLEAKSHV